MATPQQVEAVTPRGLLCPVCDKVTMFVCLLPCPQLGSPHYYCTNCQLTLEHTIVSALRRRHRLTSRLQEIANRY